MARIHLEKVSKQFADGTQAISEASFTVQDGEFFILVGPSGCGKSTLLNMIVGLEEVSDGEIRVNDQIINDLDPRDRNMAMVFQSYALYPHMTVRENIAFPLRMARLSLQEINQRVDEAADILELSSLLERKPQSLSGGQRQRVAMGRAIVRHPVAFLLDEPLSNLDARLRIQMRTEIARLQKRLGTTTIYVTHDQTEAMTLGDRIAVLKDGVIQQIGSPRDLYEQPHNLFVAGFIGSPSMNFLPARLERERLHIPLLDLYIPVPASWSLIHKHDVTINVGIRPEHIYAECGQNDADNNSVFSADIDVIEWMGAETIVYFQFGKTDMTARLQGNPAIEEGTSIRLALDVEKLHLFDTESGERLVGYNPLSDTRGGK